MRLEPVFLVCRLIVVRKGLLSNTGQFQKENLRDPYTRLASLGERISSRHGKGRYLSIVVAGIRLFVVSRLEAILRFNPVVHYFLSRIELPVDRNQDLRLLPESRI
jgi:hypothetical protein